MSTEYDPHHYCNPIYNKLQYNQLYIHHDLYQYMCASVYFFDGFIEFAIKKNLAIYILFFL